MSDWLFKRLVDDLDMQDGTTFGVLWAQYLDDEWLYQDLPTVQEIYDHVNEGYYKALDYMLNPPCIHHQWYVNFEPGDGSSVYWCEICGKCTVHESPG